MTSDFTVRTATADEYERVAKVFTDALLIEFHPDPRKRERFEPERALLAEADGEIVGVSRVLTRDLSVPGGVVPVAHISGVGVSQTFRRRGVLSALQKRQLSEVPEALAALWASQPGIYERFGYAPAAFELGIAARLPQLGVKHSTDSGALRELDPETAAETLAPVLNDYQWQRPGVSGRGPREWAFALYDPPERRQGALARRVLAHYDANGLVDGYALWRGKFGISDAGAGGEVTAEEVVATTTEAYQALWSHLLTMDLCTSLKFSHLAVDDSLTRMVSDPRALATTWGDSLWVRVTDVRRALEQRRYGAPIDLVIEVFDDIIESNNGRFRLTGDADKARCVPTDEPADLSVPVNELSAVYLGGRSLVELSYGTAVTEHTPGSLFAASAGLRWPIAPGSIEIF